MKMKLRWNVKGRRKITADLVKRYKEVHGCSIQHAKKQLMQKETTLEYFDYDSMSWKEVPTVFTATFTDEEFNT